MHSKKTTNRSSVSAVSKSKEQGDNTLYISEYIPVVIYHAEFYNQFLLICTNTINIYNIETMTLESKIKVKTHWASFIPFSDYLCFPDLQDQEKKSLVFWNFKTEEVQAKMTFNFSIEQIRCSRRAITLTSLQHLYVIQFPSLKPIYEGFAGNGIKVVFDASREGLTLAHNTDKRGDIIVRNFTNIQTNKLLNDLQSHSKFKSFSNVFKEKDISISKSRKEGQNHDEIQQQINIKAHNENVVIVRLSPNGYRVATASIKGTIIRMHSCLKGQLISQFRVGYSVARIVDIQFISEGSQIACLNDSNEVSLFHTRMSALELLSESSRRGYEIYEQKNPTSFFSFLGFLNLNLYNEYPFSFFQLDLNKDDIEDFKSKLNSQKKDKEKMPINEIKEVHESHHESDSEQEKEKQKRQKEGQKPEMHFKQVKLDELPNIPEEIINQRQKGQFPISFFKKHSLVSHNNFKSLKIPSHSIKHKNGSTSSAGKNSKGNAEIQSFGEKEKKMSFKGIINFGSDTNVRVLQGKYLIQLKYDPFNGGRMVEKESYNLLKQQIFSDL